MDFLKEKEIKMNVNKIQISYSHKPEALYVADDEKILYIGKGRCDFVYPGGFLESYVVDTTLRDYDNDGEEEFIYSLTDNHVYSWKNGSRLHSVNAEENMEFDDNFQGRWLDPTQLKKDIIKQLSGDK